MKLITEKAFKLIVESGLEYITDKTVICKGPVKPPQNSIAIIIAKRILKNLS